MSKLSMQNDFIVVVSGLPRSGTSMMMQMLKEGGMPLFADDIRKPDEDNPKGYYEYERVKDLEKDNSWLEIARGKAIKIVSPLLFHLKLDGDLRYKIIFMRREIDEILASQKKMAERLKRGEDRIPDEVLRQNYLKHLEEVEDWVSKHSDIEFQAVDYALVVKDASAVAEGIKEFLNLELNTESMAKVVTGSLHRQKAMDIKGVSEQALEEESDSKVIMERLKSLGYL